MFIIIGLGNPGKEFGNTPHNVGFKAIELFAEMNNFPAFSLQKKHNALISEGFLGEKKVLLAEPQTYMNESGKSAQQLTAHYKLQTTDYVVVHDDIDLEIGKIKIVKERGSAGHKGVESIIHHIGNNGLIRIRIGIASASEEKEKAKSIVLKNFSPDQQKIVDEAIAKTVEALYCLITEGLDKAMSQYN